MQIIKPGFEILAMSSGEEALQLLEVAGRTCYKSEDKITLGSAQKFIAGIVARGHESVIEHIGATVRFICDRGVTHELVRHRLAAYSQESTRYANYAKDKFGNEITVVQPVFWPASSEAYARWKEAMEAAEKTYLELLAGGARPEEARSVLPNSLKTEIIMTANMREWRHVLKLRCGGPAHPQIREIMLPLLKEFYNRVPVLFADLYEEHKKSIEKFANMDR